MLVYLVVGGGGVEGKPKEKPPSFAGGALKKRHPKRSGEPQVCLRVPSSNAFSSTAVVA